MKKNKIVLILTLVIIESSFCLSQTDIDYYDYWFTSIDEALKNPEVVINVDLCSQDLKEIPIELKAFENLQMLLLDSNFISEVPEWIRDFKSLWYVSIGYNNLERIPSSLTKMKQLEHLSLRNNKITKLANTPFCQKSLSFLDLAYNQLTQVPKFSRKGVYLESFFLNNNLIEMEKKSFKNIKGFDELDLRSNEVCIFNKELFKILCNLDNSPYVYLESNPFDDEDKEMINFILNAYFIRKTNRIRPLDHYLEIYW
jgi:Leucine-rich repeat (LRR) protein